MNQHLIIAGILINILFPGTIVRAEPPPPFNLETIAKFETEIVRSHSKPKPGAPQAPPPPPVETFYDRALKGFGGAHIYEIEKDKDRTLRIGRCFPSSDGNIAVPAFIAIQDFAPPAGPIAGVAAQRAIETVWKPGESADFFDGADYSWFQDHDDASLKFHHGSDDGKGSLKLKLPNDNVDLLRQDDNYVYETLDTKDGNGEKPAVACYYFLMTQ